VPSLYARYFSFSTFIARIKASLFIPHKDSVSGFAYEVETSQLREVSRLEHEKDEEKANSI
jgi:hypothetical protein